jgi:hypothetical protein
MGMEGVVSVIGKRKTEIGNRKSGIKKDPGASQQQKASAQFATGLSYGE